MEAIQPWAAPVLDLAAELSNLVGAVGRRDQAALGRLYDLTVDRVFAVSLRVLGNRDDAEEVVGDVFLQVWERAQNYCAERGGVLSWLSVIAYSRAIDLKRRQSERNRTESLHPDEDDPAYTDCEERPIADLLDLVRSGSAAHLALSELPEQPRRLIAMAFLEDLSHQEISERTGIPLGTVKSHIRRGLLQLREKLSAMGLVNEHASDN